MVQKNRRSYKNTIIDHPNENKYKNVIGKRYFLTIPSNN